MQLEKRIAHPYMTIGWALFIILSIAIFLGNSPLIFFDMDTLNYFGHYITSQRTALFQMVAMTGSPIITGLLSIGLGIILWHSHQIYESLITITTTVTGDIVGLLIKLIIQRPRPTTLIINSSGYSFPSEHVIGSVIFVFTIMAFGLKLLSSVRLRMFTGMVLLFWLGLVAISRMYLQVHYPTDVIGGALFAILWCETILTVFRQKQLDLTQLIKSKRGIQS